MKFLNLTKKYALIVEHVKAWEEVEVIYLTNNFELIQKTYAEEYKRVEEKGELDPRYAIVLLDIKKKEILKGKISEWIPDFKFCIKRIVENMVKIKYIK